MANRDYVNISLSLPAGIWDAIGTAAAANSTSPGELVARALAEQYGTKAETPIVGPGISTNPTPGLAISGKAAPGTAEERSAPRRKSRAA